MKRIIKRPPFQEERCLICLELLFNRETGTLSCGHSQFCHDCILEWANITNKCPLCGDRFSSVQSSSKVSVVTHKDQEGHRVDPHILNLKCTLCNTPDCEDKMLLCDSCDRGFHTFCLGLRHVPILEEWFCQRCAVYLDKQSRQRQSLQMMKASRIKTRKNKYLN